MVHWSADEHILSQCAFSVFYARILRRRRIGEIAISALFTHRVRFWRSWMKSATTFFPGSPSSWNITAIVRLVPPSSKSIRQIAPYLWFWLPGQACTLNAWSKSQKTRRSPPYTDRPCCWWPSTPSPPLGSLRHSRSCRSTDTWAGSSTARWSDSPRMAHTWWTWRMCSARPCACLEDICHRGVSSQWTDLGAHRWGLNPPLKKRTGQIKEEGTAAWRGAVERADGVRYVIVLRRPNKMPFLAHDCSNVWRRHCEQAWLQSGWGKD